MAHVAVAADEHAEFREPHALERQQPLRVARLETLQAPVGAMRGQGLDQTDTALAVDEGQDLYTAGIERQAVDRSVAAFAGHRTVDVGAAEDHLGFQERRLDERIGPRHLAGEGAQFVGIEVGGHHDLGADHAPERRRNGAFLAVHGGQTDAQLGVGMRRHRHDRRSQ